MKHPIWWGQWKLSGNQLPPSGLNQNCFSWRAVFYCRWLMLIMWVNLNCKQGGLACTIADVHRADWILAIWKLPDKQHPDHKDQTQLIPCIGSWIRNEDWNSFGLHNEFCGDLRILWQVWWEMRWLQKPQWNVFSNCRCELQHLCMKDLLDLLTLVSSWNPEPKKRQHSLSISKWKGENSLDAKRRNVTPVLAALLHRGCLVNNQNCNYALRLLCPPLMNCVSQLISLITQLHLLQFHCLLLQSTCNYDRVTMGLLLFTMHIQIARMGLYSWQNFSSRVKTSPGGLTIELPQVGEKVKVKMVSKLEKSSAWFRTKQPKRRIKL